MLYVVYLGNVLVRTQFESFAQKVSGFRPNEPNTMNL